MAAIVVDKVSKTFKLPHEKQNSIKGLFVNAFKHKRTFEKQTVLKNVSFQVEEGDFFAIVGRNGSGKSTLLKLLAGIYEPDNGGIHVNGKLTPFIELGVGFNQNLTGRENVFLNGALLGFSRKDMLAMYQDIVDFAELERFMDQKLKNYSSGMQVRLAFSIAIRAQSDILLLDEVLAVGDAAFQQKCFNYFEELKRNKKTVVFVSHDMGAVRRFCNKAVYIENGNLIKAGTALEIADHYTAENIESAQKATKADGSVTKNPNTITSKIARQTDEYVEVEVSYESNLKDELYIGLAVMRDGIAVAEISTPPSRPLKKKGTLIYQLDIKVFNPGIYQVDTALFKADNRELLNFTHVKPRFTIKGNDPTKGGALALLDTWQYK